MIEEAKRKINGMFERSQTKLIFPVITLGLLKSYNDEQKEIFTNLEIGRIYNKTVQELKTYLGHDLHIGGKYYDAYPSRNLPKYGVLVVLGGKSYRLGDLYKDNAKALYGWLIVKICEHIKEKLGIIIQLSDSIKRTEIANDRQKFINIVKTERSNFDKDRLEDGKVILIIEEVSKEIKQYLINMKVQSISKEDIVKLTSHFEDAEDRMKVLRIVYDEFTREYASDI